MKPIRFTRGSRKHRIGKASTYHVLVTAEPTVEIAPDTGDELIHWIGPDERDRELHIIAIEKPNCFLVIHVQPTSYERSTE